MVLMKYKKRIVKILIVLITVILYFNDNKINIMAGNYNKISLSNGEYYRSGDVITKLLAGPDENNDSQYFYEYSLFFYSIQDESKRPYEYFYDNLHIRSSSDEKTLTMPKYKDKDVIWYVKKAENITFYKLFQAELYPILYENPQLEVKCNYDNIKIGEKVNCTLDLKYIYDVKKLNFEINNENFEINDFEGINSWSKNIKDFKYYLTNNNNIDNQEKKLTTTSIAKFTLKAKNVLKNTSLKDNIKIYNADYSDVLIEGKTEEAKTTVNILKSEEKQEENNKKVEDKIERVDEESNLEEDKVLEKKEIENPPTGNKTVIYSLLFLTVLGIIITIILKKFKFFRKI